MTEQRSYHAPGVDVEALGDALSHWYQSQGFDVQTIAAPDDAVIVQARKEDTWRTVAGLSAALSVQLTPQDDNLLVQAGAAKWADKAVVGVVTALFFLPLLALPAIGAYKQKELIDGTFRFIEQYVSSGGEVPYGYGASSWAAATAHDGSPRRVARTPSSEVCPSCGAKLRPGAKFCDNCGAQLVITCPQCGAELRAGAKFCDKCGAEIAPSS